MNQRQPPNDMQAEIAVLGSILLRPSSLNEIVDFLRPGDFYRAAHRMIYEAMLDLDERKEAIDIIILSTHLKDQNRLEEIGGVDYLSRLSEAIPTSYNIGNYAEAIKDCAARRRGIEIMLEGMEQLRGAAQIGEVLTDLQDAIQKIQADNETGTDRIRWFGERDGAIDVATAYAREILEGRTDEYVPTGFPDLDYIIHGLGRGELVIIAARPSMGKTALAFNIMEQIARRNDKPGLFISMEMTLKKLGLRSLLAEAGVEQRDLRGRKINIKILEEARDRLKQLPVAILDAAFPTCETIRRKIIEAKKKHPGLFLVVLDYLQLLQPSSKITVREQQVAHFSRFAKTLAKELNVCMLAVSQLNRKVEERPPFRRQPGLSDLRESGALEQDGDKIILLWRKELCLLNAGESVDDEDRGKAEIIVAKNRDGPLGIFKLGFQAETTKFYSLSLAKDENLQEDLWG